MGNKFKQHKSKIFIQCPDGSYVSPKSNYSFRFVRDTFNEALKNNLVVFKETDTSPLVDGEGNQAKYNIYIKKYLKDGLGAPTSLIPKSLVGISNHGTAEFENLLGKAVFSNPKSSKYLKYLMIIGASKTPSLILDFFAGSGTTAQAVMELNMEEKKKAIADDKDPSEVGNRQFILVQFPESTTKDGIESEASKAGYATISQICLERIKRASAKIARENTELASSLDLGVRVHKHTPSNYVQWQPKLVENTSSLEGGVQQIALEMKTGLQAGLETGQAQNSDEDRLLEVMLKLNIENALTAKVEKLPDLENCFWVNDGQLCVVYGQIKPSEGYGETEIDHSFNLLAKVINKMPSQVVFLEEQTDEITTNWDLRLGQEDIRFTIASSNQNLVA